MFEKLREELKNAFATTDPEFKIKQEDVELLNKVADYIVKRGLTTPALIFLRSLAPMTYIGSQALHFFKPFLTFLFSEKEYSCFAEIMEHREAPELLSQRIEISYEKSKQQNKQSIEKLKIQTKDKKDN
ncbi:MAG: hypothetical protein ABIH42_01950 [Planctomycetota bacterium]